SYIEEGYEMERSIDGVIFQKMNSLSKNSYYFADNVTDNVAYFYRVRAYANTGYSEYSYTIKVESYKDNESKNKSCFIATAVYGTPFHPHIDLLRDFRDRVLIRFDAGKAFVNIYYKYSPAIADIVGKSLILRFFCLLFILPLVYVIKFPLIAVLAFVFASGFYLKGFILKRF
ncbi:MAG: hypothetical protein N2999_08365, partial [Proteobacteria bacterium]|nr:hypothetical protein [Pseudomonadota bacterium]